MEFKEFSEFDDPESMDYDIKMNHAENNNIYIKQLVELIGVLEDFNESDLLNNYGITLQEYLHPNEKVISKIVSHLENTRGRSR